MIVEDKEYTLKKANEISSIVIKLIMRKLKKLNIADDPAEQTYITCHIMGILNSKICLGLEGYGKIYSIPNMDRKAIYKWIERITEENINLNSNINEE